MPSPTLRIPIEPLTQSSFSQFGTVIQNPSHTPTHPRPDLQTVSANQGSALKILDVTHPTDLYHLAPSKKPSRAITTMFVCSPRDLRPYDAPSNSLPSSWGDIDLSDDDSDDIFKSQRAKRELFDVQILERHPFTTQTFIPMGLSPQETPATQYLVIVAPTLPASASRRHTDRPPPYPTPERPTRQRNRSIRDMFARARPSPFTNESAPPKPSARLGRLLPSQRPKGPGLPDLKNVRAFVADGSQAVTYGPGTWHAPMVVVGEKPVDFVVVQYANGVGNEDCQEVELRAEGSGSGSGSWKGEGEAEGIVVLVDSDSKGRVLARELPGIAPRAKL
jgi:ureidoglycolate lyase